MFRYWQIKFYWSIFMTSACMIVLTSQLNYFYCHKRGIDPTFVRVFHSLSDSVTANNSGLKPSDVKKVTKCKRIFRMVIKHNTFFIPVLAFLMPFVSYAINESPINTIVYGLPNSVYLALYGYHTANVIIIQV